MNYNKPSYDPAQQYAVWDGRFQPLHKGHIEFACAIVKNFNLPLAVMIIQSSESGYDDEYSKEVNKHHKLSRNPLTLWERRTMMNLALDEQGISDCVEVIGIPRPDLFWEIASSFYPPNRFICLSGKDSYEKKKEAFWASLGEKTKVVPIDGLTAISATKVKNSIKEEGDWQSLIPISCHEYFLSIEGPRRFREADL